MNEIVEFKPGMDWDKLANASPATKVDITGFVAQMYAAFGSKDDKELTDSVAELWMQALHGYPAWAIQTVVTRLLRGEYDWHDGKFVPTMAQVSKAVRDRVDFARGMLPKRTRNQPGFDREDGREYVPTTRGKTRMMQRYELYKKNLPHGPDDIPPRPKPTFKEVRTPEEIARVDAALEGWKKAYSEAQAEKAERGTTALEYQQQINERQRLPRGEAIRRAMGLKQPKEGN